MGPACNCFHEKAEKMPGILCLCLIGLHEIMSHENEATR